MNKSRKFTALILITVFSTVFLTVFSGIARAQDEDDDEPHGLYLEKPRVFYGGLIAGANFSQVDGDYYAGYHKIAANVGGIVYAQLKKHVALSMEILYSQKGSKSNEPQPSPGNAAVVVLKYGINANYAEIPVMINYFDKRKSHAGIGVSYSRLVSQSEPITYDSSTLQKSMDLSINYPFKKNGFDFLAGAQLHLWQGLFLNIRFQYSIVPVRSDIPPTEFARAVQYNNMWVVRLMYLLK